MKLPMTRLFCATTTCIAFAFLISGCETMASIDRIMYQAAEALSEEDRVTGERSLSIADRQAQIEKGNAYIEEALRKAEEEGVPYNEKFDPDAYIRLVDIFSRVHAVSHLKDEKWKVVLIPDESINAFTTGGTYIVVHSGLEKIATDDELANVIGHEIAHVVANHAGERSSFATASLLTSSKSTQTDNFRKAFTHENEKEADEIAILYCALSGFDPYAGSRFWEKRKQKVGTYAGRIQDHPMNAERAESTREIAEKVEQYYSPGKQNKDWEQLLTSNVLWQKKGGNYSEGAGKGGGLAALLETGLNAYTNKLDAQAEERRQITRAKNIKYIQGSLKLLASKPIDPSVWRASFKYKGRERIKGLTIRMIVSDGKNVIGSSLRTIDAELSRGQKFNLHFKFDSINTYQVSPKNVGFVVDNATII